MVCLAFVKMVKVIFLVTLMTLLVCVWQTDAQSYEDRRCKCVCPSPSAVINSTQGSHSGRKLYIANVPPNKCNCVGVILPSVGDEIKGREQEFCPRCECIYENRNTTIIKGVNDAHVNGRRSRGRPRKRWHDQVNQILDSGHVKSQNNRRVCMRRCMNVNEARSVYQDRVVQRCILSAYPCGETEMVVVIIVIWVIMLLVVYMGFLICLDPLLNKRAKSSYQEHTNEEDEGSISPGGPAHPMGTRGNVLNRVGHQQDKWKRQVREQRRNIYDRHTMLN